MMISVQSWVQRWQRQLLRLLPDPRVQLYGRAAAYVLGGFCLSAAALTNAAMPLAMGFVCACQGWSAVLAAAGGCLGYLVFWGTGDGQWLLWLLCGLGISLGLSLLQKNRTGPFLLPALAALAVSGCGLFYQFWQADTTPVGVYLLRIAMAGGSSLLFDNVLRRRDPITDWLAGALIVLALAQIMPIPYFGFGYIAVGILAVAGAFPAAALAGLALDLSRITPVCMTAVLCGGYLIRFVPRYPKWLGCLGPGLCCLLVQYITGTWDLQPLPGLFLGAAAALVLPLPAKVPSRRGETGVAQVRLEMAAGALLQTRQLLMEAPQPPVDEDALVTRAAEQACAGCPCRKNCRDSQRLAQLPGALLHKSLLSTQELPLACRKSGRFLAQLHRSQEQLRNIQADRLRQQEYRSAVMQQYCFLAQYLQGLSDQLSRKLPKAALCFQPQVQIFGNKPQEDNGDRCAMFAGVSGRYYVLLCDGMGTGMGAVWEGQNALELLKKLLCAGYPAEHALESLNSICALRSRAGAVTVDLLELTLDSGKGRLFKWGAAPSYLVSGIGAEKIGTAGPPPGLSVADREEAAYRLSLRRGEILFMVSDGIDQQQALHRCLKMAGTPPGEVARSLLEDCRLSGEDDATVITVGLRRADPGADRYSA